MPYNAYSYAQPCVAPAARLSIGDVTARFYLELK